MTPEKLQFVTFMVQQYHLSGSLITAEKAYSEYGLPVGTYNRYIGDEDVKAAFLEHGIITRDEANEWANLSLTQEQLIVANTLLDLTDTRSTKKKLQDLGSSTTQYQAWLKDPVFQKYIHTRANQLIGENVHEIDLALMDKVRSGDLKAIAYVNEMTGRFVQQNSTNSGGAQFDIQATIIAILEIIDDEVHDSATAVRISDRLRKLISARTMASQLMTGEEEPIEVPAIMPNRELPDDLKELAAKGAGYE